MLDDAIHWQAGAEVEAAIRCQIASLEADQYAVFHIWSENAEALEVFLELSSQWLMTPMGAFMGLDGKTLLAYLELTGESPAKRREIYNQVQTIAAGAIAAWREQTQQQQPKEGDVTDGDQ